ncbi:MAG: methyltransferase domain-containing protein [Acidobacteria bacterium]|nr:methyltransferase domain-containing protein [Acidobacteriota bacterium]
MRARVRVWTALLAAGIVAFGGAARAQAPATAPKTPKTTTAQKPAAPKTTSAPKTPAPKAAPAQKPAEAAQEPQPAANPSFEPSVGQPGKDVVWVPTPQALVDKMLDMAGVTPKDYVMDLGSGDGRTVITAAKRGATAVGIEYNPDMVALSQRNAVTEGVTARATFRKADLFQTDFSKATVITMFLLPSINMQLRPKLLDLRPGTRIVSNSFTMEDWEPDQRETVEGDCVNWCTALLWIVPAKVAGNWSVSGGPLRLTQEFQQASGSLGSQPIADGRLRGDQLSFTVGGSKYEARVVGNTMTGTGPNGAWKATKIVPAPAAGRATGSGAKPAAPATAKPAAPATAKPK